MIKISTIFVLGIAIALTRFSGLSLFWKEFIYFVGGLSISLLSLLIRSELHEVLRSVHSDKRIDTFSESTPAYKVDNDDDED